MNIPENIMSISKKFAKAITNKYTVRQIILFGSYVKGTYKKDSDIDITILIDDYENFLELNQDMFLIKHEIDQRIDPKLISTDLELNMKFIESIKNSSIIIYDSST